MLSDVFIDRYEETTIWRVWSNAERKLLVQCSQIVSEDLFPKSIREGKDSNEGNWEKGSALLCRELGCKSLYATRYQGANNTWWPYSVRQQAINFLCQVPSDGDSADRFIKARLSLVELMFRLFFERVSYMENAQLPVGSFSHQSFLRDKSKLEEASTELNARLARAGAPLNYHNGFIQISRDTVVAAHVERPFWSLVDHPRWANVDMEMKEAIDRRDSGQSDAAFYAGKALESAIKVIGHERGWTTGKEKGGADHASNLWRAGGERMLEEWQVISLKYIFSRLRNPFGHGAGVDPPLALSPMEIDWAISMSMSWISLLVRTHEQHIQAT
ncbi:hypothetical protein JJL50_08945 [Stenotrophomonas maltophilia]|uniref:HEPN AbiJ-N-terminal domain-containing protein n=1 Tax=Stenotrophomonas maltophilia TaxID=40324 RepID=A0ABD7C9D8_STEMA|nr:hypothetical protein [Stenotrophomonas maltophilia]QQQ44130.1 hypothetical protein JJL50_08945 [Stenotrophomonas maltophilia]